jgi:Holliday junction resolvasome RuvABC endonuclease subunit
MKAATDLKSDAYPTVAGTCGAQPSKASQQGESASARPSVILGVDVSLSACGAVAVPLDWAGDWGRVAFLTVGWRLSHEASDLLKVRRLESIAARLVDFAGEHDATVAYLESPAYGMNTAANALGQAEGVIRLELYRAGVALKTAPISTARKLLLGALPRRGVKAAVVAYLREQHGAPFATDDECDAFTAANWGLESLGADALVG